MAQKNSQPNLPEEILIEIFSLLDAKSVGKCRCLSKTWRSLLSTSQFIKLHLSRKNHQQNIFLLGRSDKLHTIASPITDDVVSNKFGENTWDSVLGSCNGLVLLENRKMELFLVNPITKQQVKVPDLTLSLQEHNGRKYYTPIGYRENRHLRVNGFGYDSSTDDYKIVRLSYYLTRDDYPQFYAIVDVYYVKLGVWKRRITYYHKHSVPFMSHGTFVNGSIHWLSCRKLFGYPSKIVAFDLKSEVLFEIPIPPNYFDEMHDVNSNDAKSNSRLYVLGGCLCVVESFRIPEYGKYTFKSIFDTSIDVWMMKEYGVVESWTRLCVESRENWDISLPLCFIGGNKELVLITSEKIVVMYNLLKKTTKEMAVDGNLAKFHDGGIFVDSLVSPTQIDGSKRKERMQRCVKNDRTGTWLLMKP